MRNDGGGLGAAKENFQTGRTRFPAGTTARIFRRGRSVMSSGAADTKCWRMILCGPGRRFAEPVMGWTGTTRPLDDVELKFPTLEAAIRYARRQGLAFVVDEGPSRPTTPIWPLHQMDAAAVDRKRAA
jgi:hypothetical protein